MANQHRQIKCSAPFAQIDKGSKDNLIRESRSRRMVGEVRHEIKPQTGHKQDKTDAPL
jgi:hypothetical protein